jgi:hypothetical protein
MPTQPESTAVAVVEPASQGASNDIPGRQPARRKEMRGDYSDNWDHIKTSVLIRSTSDYIVFLDADGDLDWETSIIYDESEEKNPQFDVAKSNSILTDAALLEATPCEGIDAATCRNFRRIIGEALVCSLEFDYTGARKALISARDYIRARSEETSRKWYLSAAFMSAAPAAVFGAFVWVAREHVAVALGSTGLWMTLAFSAGAVGALFSVITRTGTLKFDSSAGKRLHTLEGASRIVAGAISGTLVALAVRSGVILASLARDERQLHVLMMLAALAAGAGERLAASIISKFDSAHPHVSDQGTKTVERG